MLSFTNKKKAAKGASAATPTASTPKKPAPEEKMEVDGDHKDKHGKEEEK